jgi:Xaa-Pro aminopeptidase
MQLAPAERLHARVARVTSALAERQLDAFVVTQLSNVAYLSGFFASAAAAVVSSDGLTLIGDGRYADLLAERARACDFIRVVQVPAATSYDQVIVDVLRPFESARVAFEATDLTVARHDFLTRTLSQAGWSSSLIATSGVIENERACKDSWEIATLRAGAARLSDVAKCILPKALAGRTELDVAAEIDFELRRAGFERPAFDTIVAAGPNAARPHARPTTRRIAPGELVVLDFGGVLNGYCTDLTRTVAAGVSGTREARLIEQVVEAQTAAFDVVRPGAAPEAVDAAARQVLTTYGIGEAFTHGTGHGLGLDVHEAPRLSPVRNSTSEPPLAIGMVMTLEPGAYFPGWGGVRIEDDVLVTAGGAEWLTDLPRFWHGGS